MPVQLDTFSPAAANSETSLLRDVCFWTFLFILTRILRSRQAVISLDAKSLRNRSFAWALSGCPREPQPGDPCLSRYPRLITRPHVRIPVHHVEARRRIFHMAKHGGAKASECHASAASADFTEKKGRGQWGLVLVCSFFPVICEWCFNRQDRLRCAKSHAG